MKNVIVTSTPDDLNTLIERMTVNSVFGASRKPYKYFLPFRVVTKKLKGKTKVGKRRNTIRHVKRADCKQYSVFPQRMEPLWVGFDPAKPHCDISVTPREWEKQYLGEWWNDNAF